MWTVSYWFDGYLEELTFTSWYPAEKVVLRHFKTSLSSCFWSRINKSSKRSTWRSENNRTTFVTNWWIKRKIDRSRVPLHKRRVRVEVNLTDLTIYCFPVHICATKKIWKNSCGEEVKVNEETTNTHSKPYSKQLTNRFCSTYSPSQWTIINQLFLGQVQVLKEYEVNLEHRTDKTYSKGDKATVKRAEKKCNLFCNIHAKRVE